MVYKSTRKTGNKKPYRRRRYNRSGWMGTAKKALNIAKGVAKLVNAEYKYYEWQQSAIACTNAGAMWTLFSPTQGTSVNQREGDSCKMSKLTLEGFVTRNSNDEIFRMIVYMDKENQITTPSDLLENVGTSQVVISNKNQDNKFITKVLLDRKFTLTTDSPLHRFKSVIDIPYHVHFIAGGTFIKNNALKIMFFSTLGAAGGIVTFHARTSYVDN